MTGTAGLSLALVLVLGAAQAHAHAFLERAVPAVGSAVHGSPPEIRLTFSEELEPAFCTVRVTDQRGRPVGPGEKPAIGSDKKQLTVHVPTLPPGTYHVKWRVLSVDAHATEGDHTFEVAP